MTNDPIATLARLGCAATVTCEFIPWRVDSTVGYFECVAEFDPPLETMLELGVPTTICEHRPSEHEARAKVHDRLCAVVESVRRFAESSLRVARAKIAKQRGIEAKALAQITAIVSDSRAGSPSHRTTATRSAPCPCS